MSWFSTLKSAVDQIYELVNNEDSLGETISEFAYTIQTGYPRYVLDHFSVHDLVQFLNHPHLDSFFVLIRKLPTSSSLHYSLLYKKESDGKWYVSSLFMISDTGEVEEGSPISSVTLHKYLTGSEEIDSHEFEIDPERLDELICTTTREVAAPSKQENLLLLRPSSENNNVLRIKKLIRVYEGGRAKVHCETTADYVFLHVLNQPEYRDEDMFPVLEKSFHKALRESSGDISSTCKKITALMDDNYKVYRIGMMF